MFKTDRFRSFLSLLGITIGVFMTLSVFTLVDGIKVSLQASFCAFGDRVIFVQPLPWVIDDVEEEILWWDYIKRPPVQQEEADYLKSHLEQARGVSYVRSCYRDLQSRRHHYRSAVVTMADADWFRLFDYELAEGRIFTEEECRSGAPSALLGAKVAETLFPQGDALGKPIRVGNQEVVVAGILAPQGFHLFAMLEMDQVVLLPEGLSAHLGLGPDGGYIAAAPRADVPDVDFEANLRTLLRAKRRLMPMERDNFSMNRLDAVQSTVEDMFTKIHQFGWLVGGFSWLIGGLGIANMMLVSVRERRREIGIRKALGATERSIRRRFLMEAAAQALIGALLGIMLAAALVLMIGKNGLLPLHLSPFNVFKCVALSAGIGILSGWIPATQAAALEPVKAIGAK